MKILRIVATSTLFLSTCCAGANSLTQVSTAEAQITDSPELAKRFKDVIKNKEYMELQQLKENGETTSIKSLKPWIRTIYSTKVEIVTPVEVAGVTISAKPPATTDGLEPWISLNGDGSPKTINPVMKNGRIKNKSPDYGTYFQTATTVRYTKEELKAHNMGDEEVFDHETLLDEDLTYRSLNPIIRCTPDFYHMKGLAKDSSPAPFCFPHDNTKLYKDRTYFVTWYYRFFDDSVQNVRLHLSYVKESVRHRGTKRDLPHNDESKNVIEKRSTVMDQGGKLSEVSFFVSDWLPKEEGMYALSIDPKWLQKEYSQKVSITLQPDNLSDEEFDHLSNHIVIEIAQRAKVAKHYNKDNSLQERKEKMKAKYGDNYDVEEGMDYEKYIIIITMPTCVMVAVILMYTFVWCNRRNQDLSFLKKVKFAKKKSSKLPYRRRDTQYTELPQWDGPKSD